MRKSNLFECFRLAYLNFPIAKIENRELKIEEQRRLKMTNEIEQF